MENSLLPLLRAHNMHFVAYRPLAAGFLSGASVTGETAGTRFDASSPVGKAMAAFFGADELKTAYVKLKQVCDEHEIPTLEAGLRWICYHSALRSEDGIILGASREAQIVQNVESIAKGPLPKEIVGVIDEVWKDLESSRGGIM